MVPRSTYTRCIIYTLSVYIYIYIYISLIPQPCLCACSTSLSAPFRAVSIWYSHKRDQPNDVSCYCTYHPKHMNHDAEFSLPKQTADLFFFLSSYRLVSEQAGTCLGKTARGYSRSQPNAAGFVLRFSHYSFTLGCLGNKQQRGPVRGPRMVDAVNTAPPHSRQKPYQKTTNLQCIAPPLPPIYRLGWCRLATTL